MTESAKPLLPPEDDVGEATVHAPDSNAQIQQRAVKGWAWTLIHVGAATPMNFVINAVLARQLGVEEFGRYSLLLTVFTLGQGFLTLGYGGGVSRFGAAHYGAGEREQLYALLRSHTTVNVLWIGTSTAVLLYVLLDPGPSMLAIIVASSYVAAYLETSSLALLAVQRSAGAAQTALVIVLGCNVAIAAACLMTADPTVIILARFACGAVLGPLRLLVLPPDVRRACLRFGKPRLPAPLLRFGLTLYVSGILGTLVFARTEVVLLDFFDAAAVIGLFALAMGLAGQVTAPVDAAVGPLVPAMTSVIARDAGKSGQALVRAFKALTTAGVLWASVTIVPVTVLIPLVYGSDYSPAASVFAVGAVASFIQSATAPSSALSYAIARPGLTLQANAVGFVLGALTAVALIPLLGLWGAVVGNTVGGVTSTLSLLLSTGRSTGVLRRLIPDLVILVGVLVAVAACAVLATTDPMLGLGLWAAATPALVVALRGNKLVRWEPSEAASVLEASPPRLRSILRWVIPAGR